MRSRFLKFVISFLITVAVVFVATWFFYEPKGYSGQRVNILRFDFSKKGNEESCDYQNSIEYYSYKESQWKNNNKFGIYVYAEVADFFEIAQNLVNSNGGDWGYVLIPYNVKDRDRQKWDRVFTQLRQKRLIPIIQLWDVDVDDYKDQTEDAAKFLNSFVWPIKPRYISVYNEMNDPRFWYGYVKPDEYAEILEYTIDEFKDVNKDYFMMNGAFNVSVSSDGLHLDSFDYMYQMDQAVDGIFEKLDGWASHPYPQPNFSGSPDATGRWSIKAYENELDYLKNELGVKKDLPVFITETGWAHAEGKEYNSSYPSVDTLSDYYVRAYKDVWLKDDRVRAVTPFTIKYDAPFDHFSWVNEDNIPYKHYDAVKSMKKTAGDPPHFEVKNLNTTNCE